METYNPVELAIKASGGKAVLLAKKVRVSHQAVSFWLKRKEIPLQRVKEVSEATRIPLRILRPDFFE